MRYLFSLLVLGLLITACKKESNDSAALTGTYWGVFQRETPSGGPLSDVSIDFSGNNWSGESDTAYYPGLCHGTYELIGTDSVRFVNACVWPANFDWSLILAGDYKITILEYGLEITRDYGGGVRDVYRFSNK